MGKSTDPKAARMLAFLSLVTMPGPRIVEDPKAAPPWVGQARGKGRKRR